MLSSDIWEIPAPRLTTKQMPCRDKDILTAWWGLLQIPQKPFTTNTLTRFLAENGKPQHRSRVAHSLSQLHQAGYLTRHKILKDTTLYEYSFTDEFYAYQQEALG